jgi:hypothetical protein
VLVAVIVACEIGFWVVLLAGLVARYPLGRRRLGAVLLALTPVTDLVLLAAGTADLQRGATAGAAHGLGAVYFGFSVVFGPGVVRWADERFAHRFAGGPPPRRPPRYGAARAAYEWREFGKALLAAGLAAALLLAAILLVDDPHRTGALVAWLARLGVVLGVWAIWPVSHTLWPTRPPSTSLTPQHHSDG